MPRGRTKTTMKIIIVRVHLMCIKEPRKARYITVSGLFSGRLKTVQYCAKITSKKDAEGEGMTGFRISAEVMAAMDKMTDIEAGRLLRAMAAYARSGETIALPDRLELLFEAVKAMMDRDAASAACGKRGGRPRKTAGTGVPAKSEGPAEDSVPPKSEGPVEYSVSPKSESPAEYRVSPKREEAAAREREAVPAGPSCGGASGFTGREEHDGNTVKEPPAEGEAAAGSISLGERLPKGCSYVEDDGIPLPWEDWTPKGAAAPEQDLHTGTEPGPQKGLPVPASGDGASLSDVEEAYRAQGIPLGPWAKEEIAEYMSMGMERELLFYALEQAVSANCLKWAYCRGVLNNLHRQGVRTVSSAGRRGRPGTPKGGFRPGPPEEPPVSPLLKEAMERVMRGEDLTASAPPASA